ncbi:MAG: hypothetical protein J1F17_04175 [Oscillospiraceae bacterium]|nr:hypothetical protein [Oscillospiraceae bacterium]
MKTRTPNFNPGAISNDFAAIQEIIKQYLNDYLFTCTFVKVVGVGENSQFVNVQPVIQNVATNGEIIPLSDGDIIYNVPMLTMYGDNCEISLNAAIGDLGLIIACRQDISKFKQTKQAASIGSRRMFSFSDGVYLPLSFNARQPGVIVKNGDSVLHILPESITMTTKTVTVNSDTATVNAGTVNLGGEGGKGIARIDDTVEVNVTSGSSAGTWTGKITSGSGVSSSI